MAYRHEKPMNNGHVLKEVLQKFVTFLHVKDQHNVKSMPTVRCDAVYERPPNISASSSVYSYINYRKNVDNKLAEINNNISDMLIESFRGIDNICTKVRECVSGFGNEQSETHSRLANDTFRNAEEDTTENLLESIHEESIKTEDSEIVSAYVLESIIGSDEACSKEHTISIEEPNLIEEKSNLVRVPNFITVVGDGKDVNDVSLRVEEPVNNKANLRKNYRNDKRRKLLENLLDSLKLDVENTDLDNLQTLIENVTEKIDILGHESTVENLTENNEKRVKTHKVSKDREEVSLPKISNPVENYKSPLPIPEVYHRPGVTNLHKRLLWQLEANDSFVTFQKLMRKQQKNENPKIDSAISEINIPISTDTRSCCSQQHKKTSKRNVKEEDSAKGDLRSKYSDSLWFKGKKMYKPSKCQKKIIYKDKKEKIKNSQKSKTPRRSTMNVSQKVPKCVTGCGRSLTVTNNSPVVQNYCNTRLNWNPHKTNVQIPRRKLAYLDILDDLTNRDLLPLHSEYPRKDHLNTDEYRTSTKNVHDSYLYKIMYGSKEKNTDVWNHLLQPTIEDTGTGFRSHSQHKTKEKRKSDNGNRPPSSDKKTVVNARRKRIMKTLAPYMFDPQFESNGNYQSLMVMPVRVFYDKDHNNLTNTHVNQNHPKTSTLPLPLIPIKEIKVNRARWINPANLKKSVKNLDSPRLVIEPSTVKTCLCNKFGAQCSKSEKVDSVKNSTIPNENKRFKSFCEDPKDIQDPYKKLSKNSDKFVNVNIDGRSRTNPVISKPNSIQPKGELKQRMINKSGKTMEKHINVLPVKHKFQPPKTQSSQVEKSDSSTNHIAKVKQKQMLSNLKGLKQKNDRIQHNIQKAIDVIETKMVDVLSSPCKSASVEAFDAMEKEINNVLDLMKCKQQDRLPSVSEQSPVDSFKRIDPPLPEKHSKLTRCKKFNNLTREKMPTDNRKKSSINRNLEMRANEKMPNDTQKSDIPEKLDSERLTQNTKQLVNEPKKLPDDVLETEFNVISTDVFEKLENILYMDSHRDTSTSDIEEQKSLPKNRVDKIQSSSETTLSIAETGTKNKKYVSTGPISFSKSQVLVNDNVCERKNTKKDFPTVLVETGFAAGEMVIQENCSTNDQLKIRDSEQEIEDKINNMHEEPVSLCTNVTTEGIFKTFKQTNDKDEHQHNTALDLDHFQSKSAPLTRIDFKNISINCKEIDTKPVKSFTERYLMAKDDLQMPVPLKCTSTTSKLSDGRKYFRERAITPDCKKLVKRRNIPDDRKNTTITSLLVDGRHDENDLKCETDENTDNLENQVNKIISRVEDIYNQLDEIQTSTKEYVGVPIFRDFSPRLEEIPSQEFLTPFMQAVKHSRTTTKSSVSYPRNTLEKSPSYYNVLSFLDSLYDIHTERTIEVYQVTELHYAYVVATATTFRFSTLEHLASFSDDCKELVEKPSCLKKHSGDVCKCMKPKRVSFLVMNQTESLPVEAAVPSDNSDLVKIDDRLDHGDNYKTNTDNSVVVICDKRQTVDVSTEIILSTESATVETIDPVKEDLLVNSDVSTCGAATETSSDLSFVTARSNPRIKVFYTDTQDVFEDKLEGFYNSKSLWQENSNTKPKVVIFREVDMSNLVKRSKNLKKFTNTDLAITSGHDNFLVRRHLSDNDNKVVLLNSFYAIVYLLMFTALNMEYKCY